MASTSTNLEPWFKPVIVISSAEVIRLRHVAEKEIKLPFTAMRSQRNSSGSAYKIIKITGS